MNPKITLKNPKYCDGCPCKEIERDGEILFWCCKFYDLGLEFEYEGGNIFRPTKCISDNGE